MSILEKCKYFTIIDVNRQNQFIFNDISSENRIQFKHVFQKIKGW